MKLSFSIVILSGWCSFHCHLVIAAPDRHLPILTLHLLFLSIFFSILTKKNIQVLKDAHYVKLHIEE